jgi:hypothetical protein
MFMMNRPKIHKDRPIPSWAKDYCKRRGITVNPPVANPKPVNTPPKPTIEPYELV